MFREVMKQVSSSNHMFGRAIWDKSPEGNFKIFKNYDGDLSQESPEPDM